MRRLLAVLLLVACGVLAGCASSSSTPPAPQQTGLNNQPGGAGPYDGVGMDPPLPRPAFTLTDTAGKPFSFTKTDGHPTFVYFGYTRCPDICPATMADIGAALTEVPAAIARSTYVVFISTDVKHDTGPIIAKWLSNFSRGSKATFVGLRGTKGQVDAAQAASHVFLASDGGQQHSAQVLLFGADNYARTSFVYNAQQEQQQIKHDLPLVAKA